MRGSEAPRRNVVVAITGASGAVFGVRVLELLRGLPDVTTHLVVSKAGMLTLRQECDLAVDEVKRLADVVHRSGEIGATIASGSFPVEAMLVAPCSIKTLSAIATGYTDDLVARAADVCLKEGRPLLLMVRETPLHLGHLRSMTAAAEAGAIIAPPVPAFYQRPESLADLVDHTARRALARVGLRELAAPAWDGDVTGGRQASPGRRQPGFVETTHRNGSLNAITTEKV
ncbi:4-hydroxy-3-polyprenylbenzoate decarboxylase [Lentzea xinjiangensis]|uniref:Flavin prenyltransferase UbiX n=1 Tax=Lentzea xinjiangensis TaxID=402600 RepID=A0A1H9NJY7_9PSEU|nr:UbiX family flavin prenyltransferase [Lentzea xinjiangensis]SER36280.1 4-hydroxy-3-polyprenylbenzoate decarboxylase [Lentzea xinjiangensis]